MSQLFERRVSRDSILYTSPIISHIPSTSNKGSTLVKGQFIREKDYPMVLLSASATDESEEDRSGVNPSGAATTSATEENETNQEEDDSEDSGHHEDEEEDLDASEEIILPEEEGDDEELEEEEEAESEDDEDIFKRQMSYPPLPEYIPPSSWKSSEEKDYNSKSNTERRPFNPRERLGVLTPLGEVTEPPSSAGTEASSIHRSRKRVRKSSTLHSKAGSIKSRDDSNGETKSILKSKSPTVSPERRVKFVGAGSATQSERTVTSPAESIASNTSEYSSLGDSGRKTVNSNGNNNNNNAIPEETEEEEEEERNNEESEGQEDLANDSEKEEENHDEVKADEMMEKVQTWQLGSDQSNEEDGIQSTIDSEFASILDDIIAELHSWDRLAGTGAGPTEINASRQDHLANISSQLTNYLGQVSPGTVMTNLPQLIPLVTTLLSVTEINFRAQLTSLNTVNVFIDRLRDCKTHSGMKVLPNSDLTWLVRTLCDISSESSRSVLKSEGTAALAKLVKAAGPEMICEPILFILMGNDEKIVKKRIKGREGSGNIVTTGGSLPGGAPKIKATALDTLTFALLTFPRDDFDLELVAKLACHCLIHPKRRVRQAALECLSVVANALGPNQALPLFRQFISEEEEAIMQAAGVNASNSSISSEASGSGHVCSGSGSGFGSATESTQEESDPRAGGPPSKIPIPIKTLEAMNKAVAESQQQNQLAQIRPRGGPSPSSAVSARVSRHTLPTPSLEELVEYAVKIPANSQVISRQSLKVGSQRDSSEESGSISGSYTGSSSALGQRNSGSERLCSSGESVSSISNIEYSLLELEPVMNGKGSGGQRRRTGGANNDTTGGSAMAPDIAWILNGSGPVKKCDPAAMLPKELSRMGSLSVIKSQPWASNGNSSGTESDFNNSSASQKRTIGSSDFNMRRMNNNINDSSQETPTKRGRHPPLNHGSDPVLLASTYSSRMDDMHQIMNGNGSVGNHGAKDKLPPILAWSNDFRHQNSYPPPSQEPLGRYYYPSNSSQLSPRRTITSSDSLSSRFSTNSSYNLLPNKYSLKNSSHSSQYHRGHDLISHHAMLPGAYENPYATPSHVDTKGYSNNVSSWSHGHAELGNLSLSRMPKPKLLQPITSLNREKFFDSTRRRSESYDRNNESFRSDSQHSGTTEEEEEEEDQEEEEQSESDNEKTESENYSNKPNGNEGKHKNQQNLNKPERKPPVSRNNNNSKSHNNMNKTNGELINGTKAKIINKAQEELTTLQNHGEEFAKGVNREFQVYHSRIEVEPTAAAAAAALAASMKKRGDADSAGSTHTRDSGVSVGSLPGSKTPPSPHTTPPPETRSNNTGQRLTKSKQTISREPLNRNWQSTPDVPHASDTDDGETMFPSSRRNFSGNNTTQSGNRIQANQVQAQTSASDEIMPVHTKPVLARRGKSVSRIPAAEDFDRFTVPDIKYPPEKKQSGHSRNESMGSGGKGDHYSSRSNSLVDMDDVQNHRKMGDAPFAYRMDGTFSPEPIYKNIRNSASTGNLNEESDQNKRLNTKSKSTYLEITDDESPSNGSSRFSARRDGPFGEVRATVDSIIIPERNNHSHTLPIRRNGASKVNGKIIPTKIYKGSFREINSRKGANGSGVTEVFPADLKPVTSPKHALPVALTQLQSNDWETNVDGFRQMVRMIRYNPEAIKADLHTINMAGIRHLTNLRSQVCRSAILCFKEMFTHLGKAMETDCEKISEKLLDKASDTNKFIREDSSTTLDAMMLNLTPAKGLTCLDLFGTRHRNPVVRCMAARMTLRLVQTIGPDRCLTELPERLLPMLCKFIQEGSLETRTSAKTAMSILITHPSFNSQLKRYVPSDVLRHAQKSIDALQK